MPSSFRRLLPRIAILAVCVAALVALRPGVTPAAGVAPAQQGPFAGGDAPPPLPLTVDDSAARKSGPLSSHLDHLYRADQAARGRGAPIARGAKGLPPDLDSLVTAGDIKLDDAGRVQVWVRTTGDPDALTSDLAALGMDVQRVDAAGGIVQGLVPISVLPDAAALADVASVESPPRAIVRAGTHLTEGDALTEADKLRSTLGVDGTGVRVGVISDAVEGLSAAQASSDLGAVDTTTCNVTSTHASPTAVGAGAEGTAMLEIIHDMAPGAQLYYGYWGITLATAGTSLDFNAAVSCLAAHVDVVVDDIGWFNNGPYDGTSSVSQNTSNALNNAASPIRSYVTAVGNEAESHYMEAYVSSGVIVGTAPTTWTLHRFQGTSRTTNFGGPLCGSPAPAGAICGDRIWVAAGGSFGVFLQWNDPWGNSTNDYDLLFLDESAATLYLASANIQAGAGSNPEESFGFTNSSASGHYYDILIGNYKGLAAAKTFQMHLLCGGSCALMGADSLFSFNTATGSVSNQADAGGGVLSAGALYAADNTLEPYSSRGPTVDARIKPDISSYDGVTVSGVGGAGSPFYGTSAAAPHVGGIAALLLSCNPTLLAGESQDSPTFDRTALRTAIQNGAIDMGTAGPDNNYGYGKADAFRSAVPAACMPGITTYAGNGSTGFGGDGAAAVNAALNGPAGIVQDSAGNLYVADSNNCRVRRVTSGRITTYAGSATCGFAGDGAAATAAKLNHPQDVKIDPSGNIFIADYSNCRIRKVAPGGIITTVVGNGTCPYSGEGGLAADATLQPTAMAFDGAGNLYVADASCRVLEISAGVISTIAGTGVCGYSGDTGSATSANIQNGIKGIVAPAGTSDVYFSDTVNCRIRKVSAGVITSIAGSSCGSMSAADSGALSGFFPRQPAGLVLDATGAGTVAESGLCRVFSITPSAYQSVAGHYTGGCGFSGDAGLPLNAQLNSPWGLSLRRGDVLVSDTSNQRVRLVAALDSDGDGYSNALDAHPYVFCKIMKADVNNSGTVNSTDLFVVAQVFGLLPAPARIDVNRDGKISSTDLQQVAVVFGQKPSACP